MWPQLATLSAYLAASAAAFPSTHSNPTDWYAAEEALLVRDTHGSEYGYQDVNGPLLWSKLSPNNTMCATGKTQSPINVHKDDQTSLKGASLQFRLEPSPGGAKFENLGHTVQVGVNGSVVLKGQTYQFSQFHFHTPSEHHFNDEHFSSEVHFVGKSQTGSLAVVALFVELTAGCNNVSDYLAATLSHVRQIPNKGNTVQTSALDPTKLQDHIAQSAVYQYGGSLTTPPCSQGVLFNIVAKPVYVDVNLFKSLKSVVKFNARYIQNKPGEPNMLQVAAQ